MTRLLLLSVLLAGSSVFALDREWNTYQPGDGVCYIKFPVNPEYQTQPVDSTATHLYIAKDYSRTPVFVYTVAFGEYPKEKVADKDLIKKLLDADRDGFAKSVNGKVLSEKPVLIEKSPGRDIVYSGEDGKARYLLREFIIENRVFQLVVCVPKEAVDDPDVAKFFESFQLPKK